MKGLLKAAAQFYAKLSKRERMILLGTSLVIGALLIDRLVFGPVTHKVLFLDQEIKSQEEAIKKSLHVLLRKDRIMEDGKRLATYSVDSPLPEEKEMTALLKDMEKMAGEAQLNVLNVKPGTIQSDSGVKKYLASMELEADMAEIITFFHAVESSKKLLRVEKYDIQPKGKESSAARCVMTVSRTVLSSTPPPAAPPA